MCQISPCDLFYIAGGVAGTPWYFVNGIDLALDFTLTYDVHSWNGFIQRILAGRRWSSTDYTQSVTS